MAITPNDILSKTFERSFRGYDEDQVDEFLDVLKEEIERINEENHLLMGQIMSLEEEIQTQRTEGGSGLKGLLKSSGGDEMTKAGIETAKATAARIISEAKESAEHIVQAANKKASEMMTRVETEKRRSGGGTASEAQDEAVEIVEQARKRAGDMMTRAKAEAEAQAKSILEQAQAQAASAESDMNTRLSDAKEQLESVQNAVKAYKAKLETFISGQSQAFKGFDPHVPGFNPEELNTAKAPEPTETIVPEPTQQTPKYQPYQAMENDKGYADDLKFSGVDFAKGKNAQPPAASGTDEARPTVSSVLAAGTQPASAPKPETAPKSEPEENKDPDEQYRQVLNQIRNIEKTRNELKTRHASAPIESVNPVKDMTDKVEKVAQKNQKKQDGSNVIISDEDEFVGKISASEPIEWDEPVPMSDDEKRHLREMLDDML